MADKKISQLTGATTPLTGAEVLPVVQNGETKKVSVDELTEGKNVPVAGVDFSSSSHASGMTSEILSDYEEGGFTPTDASGAGLSFAAATGRYTKIGRLIFINVQAQYPSTTNVSAAKIGGLPFPASSTPIAQGASYGYTNGSGASAVLIPASSSFFELYSSAGSAVTNAQMSATFNYISFCYIADS